MASGGADGGDHGAHGDQCETHDQQHDAQEVQDVHDAHPAPRAGRSVRAHRRDRAHQQRIGDALGELSAANPTAIGAALPAPARLVDQLADQRGQQR